MIRHAPAAASKFVSLLSICARVCLPVCPMPVLLLNYYRPYTSWLKNVTVFFSARQHRVCYSPVRPSLRLNGARYNSGLYWQPYRRPLGAPVPFFKKGAIKNAEHRPCCRVSLFLLVIEYNRQQTIKTDRQTCLTALYTVQLLVISIFHMLDVPQAHNS